MKLISTNDYITELQNGEVTISVSKKIDSGDYSKIGAEKYSMIINYKDFQKKKLELGMFTPCDKEGNVLEKPDDFQVMIPKGLEDIVINPRTEYKEALDRVLFEGAVYETSGIRELKIGGCTIYFKNAVDYESWQFTEIEDLIHLDLTLTESAIKEIK